MSNIQIKELTKENEPKYLEQVAALEKVVLASMEKEGKIGQLFITGKEDISDYVHSQENTVMIAVDEKDKVQAAMYMTQGQKAFTYNDITKYFKYGKEYQQYVKDQYQGNINQYRKDMLEMYELKLKAYQETRKKLLAEHPEYHDMTEFLQHEIQEEGNHFHEKSILRENFNQYMSAYIRKEQEKRKDPQLFEKYEKFYWTNAQDIATEFGKKVDLDQMKNHTAQEMEKTMDWQAEQEYNAILQKSKLKIYEKPNFDRKPYFESNTENAIEIDTYITDPRKRHAGTARILIYEGLKKQLEKPQNKNNTKPIYLCSTLHRDNVSSKYVSEFFGLKDSLYVNRRDGRDREVHICKIERKDIPNYLADMQDKLIVLYHYNPEHKKVSNQKQVKILQEQMQYEQNEISRLQKICKGVKTYHGNVKDITSKKQKWEALKHRLEEVKNREEIER